MSKFKVRCIGFKRSERHFTEGETYVWEDDKITNDNGYVYDSLVCGPDISKWELSDWYIFEKVESDTKFKVGDRVIVAAEDVCRKSIYFTSGMKRWCGKTVTIDGIRADDYLPYLIAEDHGECRGQEHDGWRWSEDMFAGLAERHKIIITHDGATVTAAYDGENEKQSATVELGKYAGFPSAAQAAMMKATGIACPPVPKPDMSAERRALAEQICRMGPCPASRGARNNDCPFFTMDTSKTGCFIYAADHPETQKIMEEYLAAEQDKPEPEKREYWSGKLVCIDNAGLPHWTVNRVYVVTDGTIFDDDADSRNGIKGPNAIPSCILAKFVEYKGEAQ